jgi:hypothetical protein
MAKSQVLPVLFERIKGLEMGVLYNFVTFAARGMCLTMDYFIKR